MTVHATPGQLPYPEGTEAADGPAQIGALAERLADLLEAHTTATRDALSGTDRWTGRRVWNVTTGRLEVWDGDSWEPVADLSAHTAASDPHTGYVRKATATAKGDLLVATASGVIARKAVGADGRALVADSAQSDGLAWADLSGTYVSRALVDAAGDLLVGSADNTLTRLALGSALQVLRVNAAGTALEYAAPSAGAMELISNTVLGADAASIDLTSIPATYDALRLVVVGRASPSSTVQELYLRFNGDSGTNYAFERITGSSTTANATGGTGAIAARCGYLPAANAPANAAGIAIVDIPRYAATAWHKVAVGTGYTRDAASGGAIYAFGSQWLSTAAINQITILAASGNLLAGSSAALYGIKGA